MKLKEFDVGKGAMYRTKLRSRGIVFGVLFFGTAAVVGYGIGKSGDEATRMAHDFGEMSLVGDRISSARNAADRTVPAQLAMYKSIEADVEEFDSVLRKLQPELNVYDGKFPSQHGETAKSIHSIEIGLMRASILKRQIGLAKEIEAFDPASQWSAWQERMQPLLDEEGALDKTK